METGTEESLRDNSKQHRFELQIGDDVAMAEYRLTGHVIAFTHTEVPMHLRAQGVAGRLVKYALDESRARGYRVVPLCPFVAQYIRRYPQYADLVR